MMYARLILLCGCIFASGCTRYAVRVTTYLSDELRFPESDAGKTVAVVAETEPDEPLLAREVQRKIEHLVHEHGFTTGDADSSDYVLFAFFAMDEGMTFTRSVPVYHPGEIATTEVFTSRGEWATATTYLPGYTTHATTTDIVFTRFLGMTLYDHARWVASDEEDHADAIVWRSTTTSSGSSSDLRSVIDYLLVATFKFFGEDTGTQVRNVLPEGDKRVEALRAETSRKHAAAGG